MHSEITKRHTAKSAYTYAQKVRGETPALLLLQSPPKNINTAYRKQKELTLQRYVAYRYSQYTYGKRIRRPYLVVKN